MKPGLLFLIVIFAFSIESVGAQSPGAYLGDLSWPEAERRYAESPIVILPFGAGAKEHGPHMPMNADRVVFVDPRNLPFRYTACPLGGDWFFFRHLITPRKRPLSQAWRATP